MMNLFGRLCQFKLKNIFALSIIVLTALVIGCSSDKEQRSVKKHLTTFDHIYTNQYWWSHGRGGIYWVSNNHVVLDAWIDTDDVEADRALYQVDVRDGSFLKLVDVSDEGSSGHKYCFDGTTLHVMTTKGSFEQIVEPQNFNIVIREWGKLTRTSIYSPLRCDFVEKPSQEAGYRPLRAGDGFIKYVTSQNNQLVNSSLVDELGRESKPLLEQRRVKKSSPVGILSIQHFLPNSDEYFGHSPWNKSTECSLIWRLNRTNWNVLKEESCSPNIKYGSKILFSLHDSILLEHHHSSGGKSYIYEDGKWLIIEDQNGRGASVSPDGCIVAYGIGLGHQRAFKRQKLKTFNYCGYQRKGSSI